MTIIPPLHQSDVPMLSCPEGFDYIQIQGNKGAPSIPSDRGNDVHHVMSEYSAWCVKRGVPADWYQFDVLASHSGLEAGRILDGMRLTYEVDWRHIYGTELRLALDAQFRPTDKILHADGLGNYRFENLQRIPGVKYSSDAAAFVGTLDVLRLFNTTKAAIDDAKSHPRPFEANTFQAKLYSLFVFRHFPSIEQVDFNLLFVRYKNCIRSSYWTRDMVPELTTEVQRMRGLQRALYAKEIDLRAVPGAHCWYCPKAKDLSCSLGKVNPNIALTLEERTRQQAWLETASTINKEILKDAVAAGESPQFTDETGKVKRFGHATEESITYPLDRATLSILNQWASEHRADDPLTWGLVIGTTKIKQRLDTKMRRELREQLESSVVQAEQKPVLKFITSAQEETPEEEFDDSF